MNNNRGNNRRRGRGNNNGRPQNGGQQLNRIDSRARGNAPQLLEKYRKLAQDAHLNGDRVQAEYYLQFADHYFRVIADTRVRQEETRARRDDRWQENGDGGRDDGDENGDFTVESDFPAFDAPPVYTRREREDRPEPRPEHRSEPRSEQRQEAAPRREPRSEQRQEAAEDQSEAAAESGDESASNIYEPVENPFLRENRGPRAPRGRREERRPRREERGPREERAPRAADGSGLESALPPAISAATRKPVEPVVEASLAPVAVEAPLAAPVAAEPAAAESVAPKRRAPRRKPVVAAPAEGAE